LPIDSLLDSIRISTRRILSELAAAIEEKHSDSYLANLFKNAQKCKELAEHMTDKGKAAAMDPVRMRQAELEFGKLSFPLK